MATPDTPFFPRKTVAWTAEQPTALRRVSLSVVQMAVITGVVLRVGRWLAYAPGSTSFLYLLGTFAAAPIFLLGMAALHLANYTIRHWLWRAPVFAALESATEMVTSLALITFGREFYGSQRAGFDDWFRLARIVFQVHLILVPLFAVILAGVVQVVRYAVLKHEHRDSTARAIHEEHERVQEH
jgi:hypothetical protein